MKALFVLLLLTLSACATKVVAPASITLPEVDFSSTINAQEGKDKQILEWTNRIEASVAAWMKVSPSEHGPAIIAALVAQRNEITKNPASNFNVIIEAYKNRESILKSQGVESAKIISTLRKENESLKNAAAQETVSTLRKVGFGCLGLALVVGYVGFSMPILSALRPWAFILVGLGVLCLAFAQLWAYVTAQWWFMPLTGAIAIGIIVAVVWAAVHSYKQGTLAQDAKEAADEASGTLKAIVGAVEEAKKTLGASAPITSVLALIKDKTSPSQQIAIENVVNEIKTSKIAP
jgi:hypothetical protein